MNAILNRLNDNAALVADALSRYLSREDERYPVLAQAMRYSVMSGGKRIRPALTLEVCRMLGGCDETALPLACAIEMIHTYSLIHDDLPCMDNDTERRGKPTNHVVYGEANALLAGDGLLTDAFGVAAGAKIDPMLTVQAISLLSEMAGSRGMVGGQVIDLIGDHERLDYETLKRMERMKTGCLIKCACLLGVLAAGYPIFGGSETDMARANAITTYAACIGLAFQIEDDILDAGEEAVKTTFLTYLTIDEAKEQVEALTRQAIEAISGFDAPETLIAIAKYLAGREI